MDLNKFASIFAMRNCNNSLTIICLCLSKRSTSEKVVIIDPLGRLTGHSVEITCNICPSVPTFQNLAKQNHFQMKVMITTGINVGLAEGIIDDTHVLFTIMFNCFINNFIYLGIDWQMVDFGMDLQACITMFEKPMGILAILEEESLFPKATDKTFEEKLKVNHLGKSPNFAKPQTRNDKDAHFAIVHYAGTVSYNLAGWLEKNKDPLNDTVVELLKTGSNKLVVHIFHDHPGQSAQPEEKGKKGKKAKGGGGKTVSTFYKNQLDSLMNTLNATEPHFIRCIVPNR